jgi:hypothetical protein
MSRQASHIHSNCNDNPKGFLKRLTMANGNGFGKHKSTQYFICDCCEVVVLMQQVELK